MKNEFKSGFSNKIGIKIKLERMKRQLSQDQLAALAGLDRGTISKIERAAISPTIATIEKIANALNIPFLELINASKVDL